MVNREIISFSALSIECIACTPVFKKELQKILGVVSVKPLVMMNMINVEIDPSIITKDEVKKKLLEIATRAGLKEKIVFHN
jgi:copper chaperone CopZ